MSAFRVALSGDFFDAAGQPAYPMFDLSPLREREDVELIVLEPCSEIAPEQVADIDALILLMPRVTAQTLSGGSRLAVVARFGVGYDNVDVEACTANGRGAGDHARRRAPPGRGLDPDPDVRPDRQAHGQGPPGPRRPGRLGREDPTTTASGWSASPWARSASATSAPSSSAWPSPWT